MGGVTAVIFPLLYGFNGYLTLWGQHTGFGVVFSLIPLTLWAYEVALQRRRWWPLALSLGVFLAISFYFFLMFSVFFALFAVVRAVAVHREGARGPVRDYLRLGLAYLAAPALAAWAIVPVFAYLGTSPRSQQVHVDALSLFPLFNSAGLLRVYSNNVFGSDIWYRGPINYYELPQLACGLLTLLLTPHFFRMASRRERWWAGAALGLIALSLVSPFVSQAFVGFTAPTYRHSFVWAVLCLYLAASVFHRLEGGERLHRGLLAATGAVLVAPAALAAAAAVAIRRGIVGVPEGIAAQGLALMRLFRPGSSMADFLFTVREELAPVLLNEMLTVLALLGAYLAVLLLLERNRRVACGALLALTLVELAAMTWPTVNQRVTLTKDYPRQGQGYFDATGEALRRIRAEDPGWHRVDKTYRSVFLNDPLFQGYFGTSGYTSISEPSTLAFLRALEVPTWANLGPNYIGGFGDRDLLNSLVGVKYLLSKEPVTRPGYRPIGSAGDVRIYRNERALPLGFVVHELVDPSAFAALAPLRRDLALLQGFVPGESLLRQPELLARHARGRVVLEANGLDDAAIGRAAGQALQVLAREPFEILAFREDRVRGRVAAVEAGVLFLSIPFNRGWQASLDGRPVALHRIDAGFTGVLVPAGPHQVELRFVPQGSRVGLAVSLLAVITGALWVAVGRWRARHPPEKVFRGC
jgi:uncharacterized membrane protein YfhO